MRSPTLYIYYTFDRDGDPSVYDQLAEFLIEQKQISFVSNIAIFQVKQATLLEVLCTAALSFNENEVYYLDSATQQWHLLPELLQIQLNFNLAGEIEDVDLILMLLERQLLGVGELVKVQQSINLIAQQCQLAQKQLAEN